MQHAFAKRSHFISSLLRMSLESSCSFEAITNKVIYPATKIHLLCRMINLKISTLCLIIDSAVSESH